MIKEKIVIYPGTFDPITLGHLDIIRRSAALFDKLIIAVATDTSKKTLFSANDRANMIGYEIKNCKMKNVIIKQFKGLLVKFVTNENANIIIRGLRAVADFEYEFQMSFINRSLDYKIETVFLPATENVHFVSSTFVKEIMRLNGDTKNLVTPNVRKLLIAIFKNA